MIIAPHAGYAYSGAAAAWAYATLDISPQKTKRIFLLGPSHHLHLSSSVLSQCSSYATPLGSLPLDTKLIAHLRKEHKFQSMSMDADEDEHSLEMHLPYICHLIIKSFGSLTAPNVPLLVPLMVGSTSPQTEREQGRYLAPYLSDEANLFIISSDFCHWGQRFGYTQYFPKLSPESKDKHHWGIALHRKDGTPSDPAIHESIEWVDRVCMDAIETGSHDEWCRILARTRNTVCGRHPIGVILAAMEEWTGQGGGEGRGYFRFVRYERSSLADNMSDSSVSYASAYAVM